MLLILVTIVFLSGGAQSLTYKEWEQWKLSHGKIYKNEEAEENRMQIWLTNYKLIEEHNRQEKSFKLALNHFADLVRKSPYL